MTDSCSDFFQQQGRCRQNFSCLSSRLDSIANRHRVLTCDLDPQANLSAAFLDEEQLETLWKEENGDKGTTIFKCVKPLSEVGDLLPPALQAITPALNLIPGDLALSGFEDELSAEWPKALDSGNLHRPFRILTSFWTVMQKGAEEMDATVILADVGPNLGAINRSALIATDHVIVPLGADRFPSRAFAILGRLWHAGVRIGQNVERTGRAFPLPEGRMKRWVHRTTDGQAEPSGQSICQMGQSDA